MFSKDKGLNIEETIIAKNRIPALVKDAMWLKLFGDVQDKLINNARKELEELLQKQYITDKRLREKDKEKKKIMTKILMLSDEINNNSHIEGTELLGQYQQEIYTLNDEIDNLTFELEMLPKEIRETNLKLIKATVNYAYKQISDWESNVGNITTEIEDLRNKLRESIEMKNDYEEKVNATYRFLHGILGSKAMEKLDKDVLD